MHAKGRVFLEPWPGQCRHTRTPGTGPSPAVGSAGTLRAAQAAGDNRADRGDRLGQVRSVCRTMWQTCPVSGTMTSSSCTTWSQITQQPGQVRSGQVGSGYLGQGYRRVLQVAQDVHLAIGSLGVRAVLEDALHQLDRNQAIRWPIQMQMQMLIHI